MFSVWENDKTSIPLLITNYHVLENAVAVFVELHIGENGMPTDKSTRIQFDNFIIGSNKLGNLELVAVPMVATLMDLQNKNINIFFRSVD